MFSATSRYIVHVDMDAFFSAIEQRDHPQYRGRPVVVGADPKGGKGRGVVSTCSYEARAFGIRSAMPISHAYRACPSAIFLPVDMDRYEAVSGDIYRILAAFTPDIEPAGLDEAYLDITRTHHLFGTPRRTCERLKEAIRSATRLTASVGLAPTMMASKIASDLRKPDGLVVVDPSGLSEFLRPLDVRRLWGLGPKTEEALRRIGIRTIGDIAARDRAELIRLLGENGGRLWESANGIDDRAVSPPGPARSIGAETTFELDTADNDTIEAELVRLCEKVSRRLRAARVKARTITLKIRLSGFETYTRSVTRADPTDFFDDLYKEARELYNTFTRHGRRIRLVGVKASSLATHRADRDFFAAAAEDRTEKTHRAIDRITERFGPGMVYRARGLAYHGPVKLPRKDPSYDRTERKRRTRQSA